MDDLIIFYTNVEGRIKHVNEIFKALVDSGVTLNIANFHFFRAKCNIWVIWSNLANSKLTRPMSNLYVKYGLRQNKTQLRSFVGLCNFFRRSINNFIAMTQLKISC